MSPDRIVVGSRASRLARAQTQDVIGLLRAAHPGVHFVHKTLTTTGDHDRTTDLPALANRAGNGSSVGLFTKELERALLTGEIDVAVHSLKDLPTALPEGLTLAPCPPREDVLDALCGAPLEELAEGARVGTSSPRRRAQLLAARPDLRVEAVRGNVPTRLRKVTDGQIDGVLLAAAGLRRLGLGDRIDQLLPLDGFLPAPGQGALALEHREGEQDLERIFAAIGDPDVTAAVAAERQVLRSLEAGCSLPVGALGRIEGGRLALAVEVLSPDGARRLTAAGDAAPERAEDLARELTEDLLDRGAAELLREAEGFAG